MSSFQFSSSFLNVIGFIADFFDSNFQGFPSDMTLDGELFGGRGKFQSTVSIVKTPGSGKWKDVKFYVSI